MVNEFALKQVLSNEQPEEVPDDEGQNDDKDGADSEYENGDDMEMEISDSADITEPNCSATCSDPGADEGEPLVQLVGADEEYESDDSTTAEQEDE